MNGFFIIIFFIFISLIKILIFDNQKNNKKKINNEYLPPMRVIKYIWIFIIFIIFYLLKKIENEKDKNLILKFILLLFLSFCLLYEEITKGKTTRFFKNFNYFILIFFILLVFILNKKVSCNIFLIIPILLWFMYICVLTLLDDLNKIKLYE